MATTTLDGVGIPSTTQIVRFGIDKGKSVPSKTMFGEELTLSLLEYRDAQIRSQATAAGKQVGTAVLNRKKLPWLVPPQEQKLKQHL